MKKTSVHGFTLVELLVSISVIAILSTVGFIEYRTFSANQILNSSVNDVQSFLRVAQSNATAAVTLTSGGVNYSCKNWVATFRTDGKNIDLICEEAVLVNYQDHIKSTLILPANVTIGGISTSCIGSTFPTYSTSVAFSALYGKPSIVMARGAGPPSECISTTDMIVTIQYSQGSTTFTKKITISTGGKIDAE
ncbi:hypothetical protein A3J13_01480 [Candidatus Daviesbacteria bacterium RIFCSPLOWO2_02_FULL_36_8]|uniref:General secretion pathway GspH domain-containing protein n=1 Tax=Candidatus Daviesbacteria bacterium RIFCSPLOWO2_02_FULL_36_8 TaxID=1797793 RepID=A0A1F5MGU4_9BACT|nr:MAG: hypothetical protein A3J13_01480 [Candidatus Daviesbacteria bacterium RIFCSPLOWO2_02_FULL_36_8]